MNRVILVSFFFCLAILGCVQEKQMQEKTIHVNQISGDATPEVLDIFLSATPGQGLNITFKKGTYHFYPDKALELYRHITNHDDVITRCAFPIIGMQNVSINGKGSEFIFHGLMLPFIVEDSKNVTLENFSIDWETPFSSEGLVVAVNEAKNTYDLKFSDDYPYVIRNGTIYFQKEYAEYEMGQTYFYDPEIGGIAHRTIDYSNWSTFQNKRPAEAVNMKEFNYPYEYSFRESHPDTRIITEEDRHRFEQLSPGLVRVHNHADKLPKVGFVKVMKGLKFENRMAPALHVEGTDVFTVQNVNIYHAGGMGLVAEHSSDLTLDNMNVIPPEGRMVSITSDATHFNVCGGKIIMRNCRFSNQLDDGTNIHGDGQFVYDVLGENKLGIRRHHYMYLGNRVGKPGDTIGLYRDGDMYPYVKLTMQSHQKINRHYSILTFNETLPGDVKSGDRTNNLSVCPDVLISNCEFITNRARGILLKNNKSAIVENCVFKCDMQAIIVRSGIGGETGIAENVVIRNNTIEDTPYGGNNAECFSISGSDNIEITDNTFNHYNNLIMRIKDVDGGRISGNKITNSGTYPLVDPERPAFTVSNSKNVAFVNNSYSGLAKEILETGENCENVVYQ